MPRSEPDPGSPGPEQAGGASAGQGAVATRRDGGVLRVMLHRPGKLNALDDAVHDGLAAAFATAASDPELRVVVLSGAGRAFSAGADLAAGRPAGDSWAARRHGAGRWQRLLELVESVPQPTVAALHGHCIGGAALLAAACDLRVATPDLAVSIPELAIGIPLTWAGVPRLAREIGLPLTRDLVMTGRTMGAEEALRCGFVTRLVDDLPAGAEQLVDQLLAMPAGPLHLTKAMVRALGSRGLELGWADPDLLRWSRSEEESRAAAAAYVRRRLPRGR